MPTYLITGAIGFIGTHISKILLESGNTVIGIDSINNAYDPKIKQYRLTILNTYNNFHYYPLDICNQKDLTSIENYNIDAVIHLAARAGVRQSIENPMLYLETNVLGTLNVLEFCKNKKIPKFVLASTSSLYGETNSNLIKESNQTDYPLTPYSVSKKSAELLAYSYHFQYGIDVSINRYFTVYGPFGRPDMSIFKFIKCINNGSPITVFGDGEQTRDFTYVEDIAIGTINSLCPVGYEIFNLGSHNPVSVNQIIQILERKLKKPSVRIYQEKNNADVSSTHADITKAKTILNWAPLHNLESGMNKTIQWFLDNEKLIESLELS